MFLGNLNFDMNNIEDSVLFYTKAIKIYKQVYGLTNLKVVVCLDCMG
jgi:hypothetical protein